MQRVVKPSIVTETILKTPTVYAFNIQRSYFEVFGKTHWNHVEKHFRTEGNDIHMLPIINSMSSSVESRATEMKKEVEKIASKTHSKVNIVAHSLAGIDARAMIGLLGGNNYVNSLTTISSPHRGSVLADWFIETQNSAHVDPVCTFLGVWKESFEEFNSKNMKDFNDVVGDSPDVKYFSVAGQKDHLAVSIPLRKTHAHILNRDRVANENDGVVTTRAAKWGEHLITFDADHMQIVGADTTYNWKRAFSLISDNLKASQDFAYLREE